MKPKTKKIVIKISVIVAILIVAAILLRMSSDTLRGMIMYNAAAPTKQKFSMLKSWLPDNADFALVADTHRLAEMPSLKNFLEEGLFKGSDTAIKTIHSLLGPQTTIGMLAMSAILGDAAPSFIVIVQGEFKEINFVESIKKELAAENAELDSQVIEGATLYWQAGSEAPFAFAIPNKNHLIVGTRAAMEQMLKNPPSKERVLPFVTTDSPFFGFLKSSDRIKKFLPPQFASLELANFWADDQKWLHVTINCPDASQAGDLKMFLSGMKALYMLQSGSNKATTDAIGTISIGGEENVVRVDAPLEQLPLVFAK